MTVKPCIHCWHYKGVHAWNPNYVAGGQYKSNVNYPCQVKDCTCNDYKEATYEEREKRRIDKLWEDYKKND